MPDTPKAKPRAKPGAKPSAKTESEPKAQRLSGVDRLRDGVQRARDALGGSLVDPAKRAGEAMRASGKTWAAGNAEIGLEMIDHAEKNVQQAFAAMRAAAKAKDLTEVMKIQTDFVRQQGESSMKHARQIGELIVRVGRDSVSPLRPGASK